MQVKKNKTGGNAFNSSKLSTSINKFISLLVGQELFRQQTESSKKKWNTAVLTRMFSPVSIFVFGFAWLFYCCCCFFFFSQATLTFEEINEWMRVCINWMWTWDSRSEDTILSTPETESHRVLCCHTSLTWSNVSTGVMGTSQSLNPSELVWKHLSTQPSPGFQHNPHNTFLLFAIFLFSFFFVNKKV